MTYTAREYAFATPKDLGGTGAYRRFCRAAGLVESSAGWGMLFVTDEDGKHWTTITSDVEYVRLLVEGENAGALAELEIPPDKFSRVREGWPDEWT